MDGGLAELLRSIISEANFEHEKHLEELLQQHEKRLLEGLKTNDSGFSAPGPQASTRRPSLQTPMQHNRGMSRPQTPQYEPPPALQLQWSPQPATGAVGGFLSDNLIEVDEEDEDEDWLGRKNRPLQTESNLRQGGGNSREASKQSPPIRQTRSSPTTPTPGSRASLAITKLADAQEKAEKRMLEASQNHKKVAKDPQAMIMLALSKECLDEHPKTPFQRIFRYADFIINHRFFEIAIAVLILANAAAMGAQVDHAMRHPENHNPAIFRFLEPFFMVAFTVEITLRLLSEQTEFFNLRNRNLKWNLFDCIMVVAAWSDQILLWLASSASGANFSAARLLRVLRLVRILRIIRLMRFFRDLRVMVAGILHSARALFFICILLLLIMYIFAVCVLQIAAAERVDQAQHSGALEGEDYASLLDFYSDLPRTIFTLYLSILGGVDWGDAVEPLFSLSWALGLLFAGYIAFAMLCVLNVVTGVFVENANKITAQDEESMLLKELSSRKEWLEEVCHLFWAHDHDQSDTIEWEEFAKNAENVRVQAWFRKVGIDIAPECMQGLFSLLDLDGDGKVNLDEFVSALQEVHGNARSIDLARVKYEVRMLRRQLAKIFGGELKEDNSGALQRSLSGVGNTRAMTEKVRRQQSSKQNKVMKIGSQSTLPGSIECYEC